jgi:catechol 2,3-dioxygenase-like lactoylglutathione lyase family enzyme
MIGYVTVGTNDLERAQVFFDGVFGEVGGKRSWNNDRMTGWSAGPRAPSIVVTKPYDQNSATIGNGTMVALAAGSPDDVNRMHAKALALGGKDEGAPGFRPADANAGFYGGYFRDLDGNKFVAFCMVPKK